MKNNHDESRRNFIKCASLAALGLSSSASAMAQLKTMNALLAPPPYTGFGNYKALVYVFLEGGNDSFNMLVPRSTFEYNDYLATRSQLALAKSSLHSIAGGNYGLHPSLSAVKTMHDAGETAFVSNVGALIEPTTVNDFVNGNVQIPLGLGSHLDQSNHWYTANPGVRDGKGWGGKIADLVSPANPNTSLSMNISLDSAGANLFQNGNTAVPYSLWRTGPILAQGYDLTYGHHPARTNLINSVLAQNYQDAFRSTYAKTMKQGVDGAKELKQELDQLSPFSTTFGGDKLSTEMEMVAKTIAVRNALGFERQIFFVRYGGWDHHDNSLTQHSNMLGILNNALNSFNSVLKELGVFSDVTTLVGSEFSRTLTSNGNGTDHAWGGNAMAMGGSVIGNIYGNYPSLAIGGSQYLSGGRLVPTTSMDSVFSELALWYGIDPSDLPTLFPNINNFHTPGSLSTTTPPLGFMNM